MFIGSALVPPPAFTAVPNAAHLPRKPVTGVAFSLVNSSNITRMLGSPQPACTPPSSSEAESDSSWEDYEAMASGG